MWSSTWRTGPQAQPRPVRRSAAVVLAGIAAAALVGAGLGAAVVPAPARAAGPALVIVLDASGSMNERAPSGRTRLAEAKSAIRSVVQTLPAGAAVGLRVYGSRVGSTLADKAAGCRDSALVVPVGPLDASRFTAAVDGVVARGWTPIGYALQEAGKDVAGADERTVILVSDGIDTCGDPEPCAVARSLAAAGVSTRIHTVGFAIGSDAAARAQLACVARAARGTYRDASDAGSLAAAVRAPAAVALRGFTPSGTPIAGSQDPVTAPALTGDGTSRSDSLVPGQDKYYAVQVAEGQQVAISATVGNDRPATVPENVCEGAVEVNLLTPRMDLPFGRRDGNYREEFDGRASATAVLRTIDPAAERWPGPGGPDPSGTWWAMVRLRQGTCATDPALPVRRYPLQVSAQVSGGAGADSVPVPVPLKGGSATTNAPPLPTDGRPVVDDITPGETRWWRLDVRDGAEAHARTQLGGVPWAGEPCRAQVQARLVNSDNEFISQDSSSFDGRVPVSQRTGSSERGAIGTEAAGPNQTAGAWFLRVSLTQGTCSTGQAIPVRRYPLRVLAEVQDFAPPVRQTTPPPTASPSPSGSAAAVPGRGDDSSALPWVLGGLAALLLAAAAVAAVLFVVLRRQQTADAGSTTTSGGPYPGGWPTAPLPGPSSPWVGPGTPTSGPPGPSSPWVGPGTPTSGPPAPAPGTGPPAPPAGTGPAVPPPGS